MSSQGAWKSSINPNIAFEPASANNLWQKGVPEWREYNRQLTEAYDAVVMERDALKRKNTLLQRDVRKLEDALDAVGQPATAGPSEDLKNAHFKIAELESALKQAQSLSECKDREIVTLRSKLETAGQGSMGTGGSLKEIDHDKSHYVKAEPADGNGRESPSPEPQFQVITHGFRPHDSDSDMSCSEHASEPSSPVGAQAVKTSGTPSVAAGILSGQPSSSAGQIYQTLKLSGPKRSRSPNPL